MRLVKEHVQGEVQVEKLNVMTFQNLMPPTLTLTCFFLVKSENLCHTLISPVAGVLQNLSISCYDIDRCGCGN